MRRSCMWNLIHHETEHRPLIHLAVQKQLSCTPVLECFTQDKSLKRQILPSIQMKLALNLNQLFSEPLLPYSFFVVAIGLSLR